MLQQFLKIQAKKKNKKPNTQCRATLWPTASACWPSLAEEAPQSTTMGCTRWVRSRRDHHAQFMHDNVVVRSPTALWRLAGGKV
jgi:hypothetical protein